MRNVFIFLTAGLMLLPSVYALSGDSPPGEAAAGTFSSVRIYNALSLPGNVSPEGVFAKGEGIEKLSPLSAGDAAEMENDPAPFQRFRKTSDAPSAPENAEFFINANDGGFFFALRCDAVDGDMIEVFARPLSGEYSGKRELHLVFDTKRGTVQNFAWQYIPDFSVGEYGKRRFTQEKGKRIVSLQIPWADFVNLFGDLPLSPGLAGLWSVNVFHWSDGKGACWGGLPGAQGDAMVRFPAFSDKTLGAIRSKLFLNATSAYYNTKTDQNGKPLAAENELDTLLHFLKQVEPSHINYGMSRRQAFTFPFSTYYMVRDTEKLEEWREQKLKYARDTGYRVEKNTILTKFLMESDYDRYALPEKAWEELRYKAMRDHLFSADFLEEWK